MKYKGNLTAGQKRILRVFKYSKLSDKQKATLEKYKKIHQASGLQDFSIAIKLESLEKFGLWVKKPYEEVTKDEIIEYFSKYRWGYPLHKIQIKSFYKWMDKEPLVEWINITGNGKKKLPEDMPTQQELKELLEHSLSARNKSIIMTLYDGALRIGELTKLKIKDVVFDEFGGIITVPKEGKTGMRTVRIVDGTPFIKDYLNKEHPNKEDSEAFLFVGIDSKGSKKGLYGKPIEAGGIRNFLNRTAKRAGIKKKIFPHIFRHQKLTEMAKQGFQEQELKKFAGWSDDSRMASVYIHLSDQDVSNKILEKKGIIKGKDKEMFDKLKPRVCIDPSCNHSNPSTNKFCEKCHRPLDVKIIMEMEEKNKIANIGFERAMTNSRNLRVDKQALKEVIREMISKGEI